MGNSDPDRHSAERLVPSRVPSLRSLESNEGAEEQGFLAGHCKAQFRALASGPCLFLPEVHTASAVSQSHRFQPPLLTGCLVLPILVRLLKKCPLLSLLSLAGSWLRERSLKVLCGVLALQEAESPACTAPRLVECLAVEPTLDQLQASQENNSCQENAVRLGFRPEVRLARPEAAPGRGLPPFLDCGDHSDNIKTKQLNRMS